ncbi:hypothetical protein HK101_000407 [Irineochytrium annulatum]|nr:hypothetical protein HK101_000407 [Irineochytrium annulatum]
MTDPSDIEHQMRRVMDYVLQRESNMSSFPTRADMSSLRAADTLIPKRLPDVGWGLQQTVDHLLSGMAPAMSPGQAGPRYFGFVTGGVAPAAHLGDMLVTSHDNNVQVHLPDDSISTTVEHVALGMVLDLLGLESSSFPGRTLTTGATASNVLGLACGRDYVMSKVKGVEFRACEEGLTDCKISVLHANAHASVGKAASLVGIGRKHCVNMATSDGQDGHLPDFDLTALEERLKTAQADGVGVILVVSYGEVNTGFFTKNLQPIRDLCDKYDGWMHVDAAFGAFAPFSTVAKGLAMADSITSDAHKWLNVPYDCGIFFCRSLPLLQSVASPTFDLGPGSAPAYLASANPVSSSIPSPLTVGIENSRRFRALPLYANLVSLGRQGFHEMVERNLVFTRRLADWLHARKEVDVLNYCPRDGDVGYGELLNIILFAPSADAPEELRNPVDGNARMVARINDTGKMYVTPTAWRGRKATRLAVSNWRTGTALWKDGDKDDPDLDIVKAVLTSVLAG